MADVPAAADAPEVEASETLYIQNLNEKIKVNGASNLNPRGVIQLLTVIVLLLSFLRVELERDSNVASKPFALRPMRARSHEANIDEPLQVIRSSVGCRSAF